MNGHELLEAVGGISGKYIGLAGTTAARNNKTRYIRWIAAAVFFCVIAVGSGLIIRDNIITTRHLTPKHDDSYRTSSFPLYPAPMVFEDPILG